MPFHRQAHRLPISAVRVTDPFWGKWLDTVSAVTIPTQHEQLVITDRLHNFDRAAKGETGGFQGYRFNDSDVYKWIEACAYSLMARPSSTNRKLMDEAVELIAKAQMTDGYLNTYIQIEKPGMQWRNISMMHEMYCGGHLIEAACAHFDCTGSRELLDVAIRWVDHVMAVFGPDKRKGACGHEEMELALLKLAETTGDAKYREFARWQVEVRGTRPSPFEAELHDAESHAMSPLGMALMLKDGAYSGEYLQDHAPIREHDSVVGHAVRAMYLYIAATQLAEGDEALSQAMMRCWHSLVDKRMYITGGIGPSGDNEGFTHDYDLPNHSAYAETCAAIGLALWGHRLFEQTGESGFLDPMERALYNGALSGISLSGDRYFYANPLESRSDHGRVPWFGCACCPPNIARLIGQVGQLAIAQDDRGVWLNLPIGMEAQTAFGRIHIESGYPWSGSCSVRYSGAGAKFALRIRIPDWCDDCGIECPNAEEEADFDRGFAVLDREWADGDTVTLDFEMSPKWIESHPNVLENVGRVALTHGPLVYCLESPEFTVPQRFSADIEIEPTVSWSAILGGVNMVTTGGASELDSFPDGLYAEAGTTDRVTAQATFIPYFAWSNRGPSHMQVWVREL